MSKIIAVGDSTVSKFNDVSYYYERYGYGCLLDKYFNLEVLNLALSGRSSLSYLNEEKYKVFLESINEGDYVVIGFGHNDEKDDDKARYTNPNGFINEEGSIKYTLYNYYIKPCLDKKATPIVCTPIVRLSLNHEYVGSIVHITKTGDYRKAILSLQSELGILVVDLTERTKELFESITTEEGLLHHAISKGIKKNDVVVADPRTVDKTHMSYLGAYNVAYLFAKEISNSNCSLKNHITNLNKPNNDVLKINKTFVYKDYIIPDLDNYKPQEQFKTENKDYYGTAFGDTERNPLDINLGYIANEKNGVFTVGQSGDYPVGRINASKDAWGYVFRRVDKNLNFRMSASCKVIKTLNERQTGFGLVLRNDCYINQDKNENISTNFIAAGMVTTDTQTYIIYSRKTPTELDKENNILDTFYGLIECKLYIERLGQVITAKVEYDGKVYEKKFIDFDILSLDQKYLYIGMGATCGTVCEFTNVEFEITGNAIEA